ncbi:hypothetical protein M9H77_28425 [Catharanthus roseus]|uniref:Uncharacterized protein n=1 Tax=Catharanthus roseus TaxID=4058 RepID=A0ACC0AGQ5_CATRO|nr:hypothetical protein M9H77_28425 [Catharanthus roseus]
MEEVPAHHEHRSRLIWSGDRETCFTDLQCRRFGHNLFQCYNIAPQTDDDLILRARGFIFLLLGSHMLPNFSGNSAVVHGSFGGCTTDRGSLSHSTCLGVVAYPSIAASTDDGCSGRPSCSAWCYMFVWLPYHDYGLVPSDLWRAEVPLICYEIVEYHYPDV